MTDYPVGGFEDRAMLSKMPPEKLPDCFFFQSARAPSVSNPSHHVNGFARFTMRVRATPAQISYLWALVG
jgi:hypothetical protein